MLVDDADRYSRFRLIAWWDQARLTRARILVVGAGALGNEVLKSLALLGVGSIHIVDLDEIETTNLTRSVLFRPGDCGRSKAVAAAEAVGEISPDTRVRAWPVDVMTKVGLGLFREVDLVIGCLDNREARLWVNRQCWKVGTPWIDGGIQEINGVVKVFVPPDSACYECAMTENDYRLINLRYSCPLLRREDVQAGKVPTSPTVASIIGGLQTQEALKLLHGLPVAAGEALVFNGVANRFYRTAFQRREDCLSHESYGEPTELSLAAEQHSARELFRAVRQQIREDGPLRLMLDRDLVVSIDCPGCESTRPILESLPAVSREAARCPTCGEVGRPVMRHSVEEDDALAEQRLAALGIPLYDIVRIQTRQDELTFLLAGDRSAVIG